MLRTSAFLLLALCVITRSFIAVGGEVHSASHALAADHVAAAHVEQAHLTGAEHHHGVSADDSEPPSPWHRLLHAAHCCGHAVAIVTTVTLAVADTASVEPSRAPRDSFSSRSRRPLHRPPIHV